MGEVFQLQYSYLTLIRCVCLSVHTALQTCGLVCTQNSWTQQRIGTEQEMCCHLPSYHHALSNNIKKRTEHCNMTDIHLLLSNLKHVLPFSIHGAVSFFTSWPICSKSRNSPRFMEPKGSLPHSQVHVTCLYPEPVQSSPHTHIPLPVGSPYYYFYI